MSMESLGRLINYTLQYDLKKNLKISLKKTRMAETSQSLYPIQKAEQGSSSHKEDYFEKNIAATKIHTMSQYGPDDDFHSLLEKN